MRARIVVKGNWAEVREVVEFRFGGGTHVESIDGYNSQIFIVNSDPEELNKWINEEGKPPYKMGALLWWREENHSPKELKR